MKTAEKDYLFKEKITEDKGEIQALKEIKSLEEHEKAFKVLWREKESLKKEVERLNKQLEKVDGFKEKFRRMKEEHTEKIYKGGVSHIRRILNHMEEGRKYTIHELAGELCMSNEDLKGCLDFLEEYKVLEFEYPQAGGIIRK